MKRLIGTVFILASLPMVMSAQNSDDSRGSGYSYLAPGITGPSSVASAQQSGNYFYAVTGPVVVPRSAFTRWDGNFIYAGGGGEARLANKFGLGGELGVLKPVTNQYAVTTGWASVTPAYHFFARGSTRKIDPFVDGGFSVLFGSSAGAAIHYGGGLNYWVRRRLGLRLEFRHHLWSPNGVEVVSLVGVRVGLTFR